MKTRLVVALAGLAIGFALPTLAQEQKTVDPEVRQQIEAVNMQLGAAWQKYDAVAAADQYTLDALKVLDWTGGGTYSGRDAIEKELAANFASRPADVPSGKLVQLSAIGDQMTSIEELSAGRWKGYDVKIYVRDADTWKIRLEYVIGSMAP
jgi:ketosteroid isomerase-like protein